MAFIRQITTCNSVIFALNCIFIHLDECKCQARNKCQCLQIDSSQFSFSVCVSFKWKHTKTCIDLWAIYCIRCATIELNGMLLKKIRATTKINSNLFYIMWLNEMNQSIFQPQSIVLTTQTLSYTRARSRTYITNVCALQLPMRLCWLILLEYCASDFLGILTTNLLLT